MDLATGIGRILVQTAKEIELELIRKCQLGEPWAFDALYDKFGNAVWRLCRRMAKNPADAEEIAQDVWVAVWQGIGSFRCESAFHTWLYKVASNTCLRWLRKRGGEPTHSTEEDYPTALPSPEAEVVEKEDLRLLLAAFAALPDSLRLPLVLKVGEGLAYSEIAQILDCTTAAVKMRISRARAALTQAMNSENIGMEEATE